MIRPACFFGNPETMATNHYQNESEVNSNTVNHLATEEFDTLVNVLKNNDIQVVTLQDSIHPSTPDSIFPNNWFSTRRDGTLIYYPMYAENRRLERRPNFVKELEGNFSVSNHIDLSHYEQSNTFLEGTGSIVFDHINRIAYCALSPRSNELLFNELCASIEYEAISFHAYQTVNDKRELIYHTNVMLSIGSDYCVICLDAIDNHEERSGLLEKLNSTKKAVIEISEAQTEQFAGNILSLNNGKEEIITMSSSAYNAFSKSQIEQLNAFGKIIHSPIPTIEKFGGGSVRCMIAEIFN